MKDNRIKFIFVCFLFLTTSIISQVSAEKISESDEIKEIVIKIQNDVGKLTKEKNVNSLWISLLPIFIALLAGFLALIQIKKMQLRMRELHTPRIFAK